MSEPTMSFPVVMVLERGKDGRSTGKVLHAEYREVPVKAVTDMFIKGFEATAYSIGAIPFADLLGLKGAVCPYPIRTYKERHAARLAEIAQLESKQKRQR